MRGVIKGGKRKKMGTERISWIERNGEGERENKRDSRRIKREGANRHREKETHQQIKY